MVTDTELERITDAQRALESDAVSFLQELIRIPSHNPPGDYAAVEERLVAEFEGHGWDTETLWAPPELLEDLGLDPDSPRPNVLGYVARGDGPTIALNAHLDTVPVDEDAWTRDPFGGAVDEGCVWGRGARDSKGPSPPTRWPDVSWRRPIRSPTTRRSSWLSPPTRRPGAEPVPGT